MTCHKTDKTVVRSWLLAGVALAPGLVSAADAPAAAEVGAAGVGLQEIIVTAEKRSEKLRDVPMSISALTGNDLSELRITDPAGLQKVVPGFVFTNSTAGQPIYTIRGIGTYDEAIGISPAVGVYVDQVPLPFPRMTSGASFDVQRVEVLKGPQGTLFGENTTGGAVNYIANKPTPYLSSGGELTYGRFNETDVQAFVSGPLSDNVTARLAARTEQRGDWQKSYTDGDTLGKRDFSTARLLIDFQPRSDIQFEFSANGWYDRSDTQAKQKIGYAPVNPGGYQNSPGIPRLGIPPDPNYQAELQAFPNAPDDARAAEWYPGLTYKRNDNFVQSALHADWNVSEDVTLSSITSFSHLGVDTPNGNDGTTLLNQYSAILGSIDSLTQELRAAGQAGSKNQLRWMMGGNYEYDATKDRQQAIIQSTNSGLGPFRWDGYTNINNQIAHTEAVFGSLDYYIFDNLTAQGSVRYTSQDRNFNGCIADGGDGTVATAFDFLSTLLSGSPTHIPNGGCVTLDPVTNKPLSTGVHSSLDQNNVSWRTGLSGKVTPDVMLYGTVSKGYKAGSYGTIPILRPAEATPVTQESVLTYEVGFKAAALQRTLDISGAAFYNDYRNKQLLGTVFIGAPFGTLPAMINIPRSRVDGGELDVIVKPFTGLTLRGGASYVDSMVKGSYILANPLGGGTVDVGGQSFPNTPKLQLTGDAAYERPIADGWVAFVGAGESYRSSTLSFFGGNQTLELPSYALLDLRAGVETGTWRIQLWGENVTNRFYTTFAQRVADTITRTVGMPATFGITVSASF